MFVDGASRGNPGPAGLGVVFFTGDGVWLGHIKEFLGRTTNNVAEYKAMLKALEEARKRGYKRLRIHTDSELMQRQILGLYKVRKRHLAGLHRKVMELLGSFEECQVVHVPREWNLQADNLAREAVRDHLKKGVKKP